ncbi:hypothetical protein HPSA50_0816 [Helicobacter pylori SouthAfrica50]|uniref:Outer membrane family protein n=1 Tax=Helicobacter pylori SouthAfrica50 TaxID=1352357 RepID=T2SAK3_HELPX|nr:hypothetical protein HPSA50_0816 [Helicobacter pylori SouthAfrica50]
MGNGVTSLGKMNNHLYGLGIDYLFNFIDNEKNILAWVFMRALL